MLALKALGESRVEDCRYCVENFEKRSFRILNGYFKPGRVFVFKGKNLLLRNGRCKKGELLSSLYIKNENGRSGKGLIYEFPLISFYFHTLKHHHAGVGKDIFTEASVDSVYLEKRDTGKKCFEARIKIVKYPYGNGDSFIFYRKRNVVQIHCIVEELKVHPCR